jgi:putative transposase
MTPRTRISETRGEGHHGGAALPQRANASIAAIDPTFRKPPRSPNPNAYCERFVRSRKEEGLQQMIVLGEASPSYVLQPYLAHYHRERNHLGLNKQLMTPEPGVDCRSGDASRQERSGGVLTYYYRDAA